MKNKKKAKISDFLLNKSIDIRTRLLNIVLFGTLAGSFVAFIASVAVGFNIYSCIVTGLIFVFDLLGILLVYKFKKIEFTSIFITLFVNDFIMPFVFFFNGGLNSGAIIWYVFSLVFSWVLLDGLWCYLTFGINIVFFIGTILLSIYKPELIVSLGTSGDVIFDSVMAVIIVVSVFGILFKYQSEVYKIQEKEVLEAIENAQKATKAKTAFITNVTHDIRTPMNAIIGYTEIAKRNSDNRSKLFNCLDKISVSSEHLLSLVNDVLEMSRIESGKLLLQYEAENIRTIVDKVSSIISTEIDAKNLNYEVDLSEIKDEMIICDSLRIKQVFLNLLSNAIKFSKPEGNILFSVKQLESESSDNIKYEFHVKDEGCGMSEEFKTRIYEPFERENNSTVSGITGSGLGLSITKNLIEMMAGSIYVNSEIGKGTEFIVKLQFEVPSLSEIKDNDIQQKYTFAGKRILVVEDNDDNRDIVCELLSDAGFEVDQARDGLFAIEKVQQVPSDYYCAILMDIQMPGKNGYDTTKIIRSFDKPGIESLPIIALSANVYEDDKRKAFEYGMDGYVTKPFNVNELLKILNFILVEDSR